MDSIRRKLEGGGLVSNGYHVTIVQSRSPGDVLQWHPNLYIKDPSLEPSWGGRWMIRDVSPTLQHRQCREASKSPRSCHGHINSECCLDIGNLEVAVGSRYRFPSCHWILVPPKVFEGKAFGGGQVPEPAKS